MIYWNSTSGKFRLTLNATEREAASGGTAHVTMYLKSNSWLRVQYVAEDKGRKCYDFSIYVEGQWTSHVVYYSDAEGTLSVPLRKFAETIGEGVGAQIRIVCIDYKTSGNQGMALIDAVVVQGISYEEAMLPRVTELQGFSGYDGIANMVACPNVLYTPEGALNIGTFFEASVKGGWSYVTADGVTAIVPTGLRENTFAVPANAKAVRYDDGKEHVRDIAIQTLDGCTDAALIRWQSATGATRQHYFPIVGMTRTCGDGVSLATAGNGYKVDKPLEIAFTVRVANLTRASLWYYADMIQADDIHCAIASQPEMLDALASDETSVTVESVTDDIAEGSKMGTFEATIKFKNYGL